MTKIQPTLPSYAIEHSCFPLAEGHCFLICTEASYGLAMALLLVVSYPCPPPRASSTRFVVIIFPSLRTLAPGYNHIHRPLPTITLRTSMSGYATHPAAWPLHPLVSVTPTTLFSTPLQPPIPQSHHRPRHYQKPLLRNPVH